MKQYATMKLVIVSLEEQDIITMSGDNEKKTDVSGFFENVG